MPDSIDSSDSNASPDDIVHAHRHASHTGQDCGYHVDAIPRGVFGEPSKVLEEALEFKDACQQGVAVMALVELCDLYGAMQAYLTRYHPTVDMSDLARMSEVTARAFRNGHRG